MTNNLEREKRKTSNEIMECARPDQKTNCEQSRKNMKEEKNGTQKRSG